MMEIPNYLRILKLVTGESVICEMTQSTNSFYKIKRPMIIRTTVQFDGKGGQREFTILRDWLSHSDEITTKLPSNHVISIIKPNLEIVDLYEKEKESQDKPLNTSYQDINAMNSFLEELEKGMKELAEEEATKKQPSDDKLILLSLALPFDQLKQLFEEDIITDEDLKEALGFFEFPEEKISEDMDTSKETDREDHGSKWTDWSPYIEDYLEDDDKGLT